jgi:hypothetical protein
MTLWLAEWRYGLLNDGMACWMTVWLAEWQVGRQMALTLAGRWPWGRQAGKRSGAGVLIDWRSLLLTSSRSGWLADALVGWQSLWLAGSRSNDPKMALHPPLRMKSNFPLKIPPPFPQMRWVASCRSFFLLKMLRTRHLVRFREWAPMWRGGSSTTRQRGKGRREGRRRVAGAPRAPCAPQKKKQKMMNERWLLSDWQRVLAT